MSVQVEVPADSPQPDRARLHTQARPSHQLVFRLVQADQVERAVVPQIVARVQAENRRRRHLKEAPLFPRDLEVAPRAGGQERFEVGERQLSQLVVDQVVHAPDQHPLVQHYPFRTLADAHRSQREGRDRTVSRDFIRQVQSKNPTVFALEGVRGAVDALVAVLAQYPSHFGGIDGNAAKRRRVREGLERREDDEGPRHRRLVLERVERGPVDVRFVQPVPGRLLVQPEEAQVGNVVAVVAAGEGASHALLPERQGEPHRSRIHVVGRRNPVDLVHLRRPRRAAGLVLGRRGLQQFEPGPAPTPVDPLRIEGADGVACLGHIGDGQHLVGGQGRPERHPEPAGMHHVVASRLQVAEPCRFGNAVRPFPRDRVGLDVAFDLLKREGIDRGAVQLDGVGSGRDGGRRRVGCERQCVDVRVVEEVLGIEEEEELAVDVVRVVEDQRVGSREGPARTLQPEVPRGHFAGLLGPHRPDLHRTRLERGLEAEAALGDSAAQESGRGQVEADVADFQALEDLAGESPVADVDPVGALELAGLFVVDIHDDTVRDGPVGSGRKADVGGDPGNVRDIAGALHGLVAGPELRPVADEPAGSGQFETQVGELVAEPAGHIRELAGRTPARRLRHLSEPDGAPQGAETEEWIAGPVGRSDEGAAVRVVTGPEDAQPQTADGDEGPPETHDGDGGRGRGQQ